MDKNYRIQEMTEQEFMPFFEAHASSVFEGDHSYSPRELLNKAELENIESLGKLMGDPFKIHLGVFDNQDNFIGWCWGTQENRSTFYMVNSAVMSEHRRKGIYSALVKRCLDIVSEKGFQLIYSRHCATNNEVIIPKLKAGFVISKMEVDDRFGVLIHLHFYTNKVRRKIMDYRSGQLKPDEQLKNLFKL